MRTTNDIHQQFAEYFDIPELKPFAYLLSKGLSEGNICLRLDKLEQKKEELPAWYQHLESDKQAIMESLLVAKDGQDTQPFVLDGARLYMQRYFRYETTCLLRILRFLDEEKNALEERVAALSNLTDFIKELFTAPADIQQGSNIADWQLAAAISGVLNNFTIITGGPGTGKTTTVARLLAILYAINPELKVALAAPTGKAAARMAESLRNTTLQGNAHLKERFNALTPATIHRLLKSKKDSPYFHHNAGNPLQYDVVIIDESSMIDVALFAKLLDATGAGTRLILLGDKDQLASVEAGSLFGDLCQAQQSALNLFAAARFSLINQFIGLPDRRLPESSQVAVDTHPLFQHVVMLQHSHRFAGDKGIGRFSNAVINNDAAVLQEFFVPGYDEQVSIDTGYSVPLFDRFIAGYDSFISEPDIAVALKKLNDLRVLCAVREGAQGVYAINKAIESWLHKNKKIQTTAGFYENRPVILTRNYYEHGLFNGDTGIIRKNEQGNLMAWFEDSNGDLRQVLPGYLTDAETAFAMTIHKSQGSEFKSVLVVLPQAGTASVLTRELLYTAVTRARSFVLIQSPAAVLLQTVMRSVERASGIAERLQLIQY